MSIFLQTYLRFFIFQSIQNLEQIPSFTVKQVFKITQTSLFTFNYKASMQTEMTPTSKVTIYTVQQLYKY